MKPYPGLSVHYVARGSADGKFPSVCRAATITEVGAWVNDGPPLTDPDLRNRTIHQRWEPYACGLAVQNPTGLFFHPADTGGCLHDPGRAGIQRPGARCTNGVTTYAGGTWHFIEQPEG